MPDFQPIDLDLARSRYGTEAERLCRMFVDNTVSEVVHLRSLATREDGEAVLALAHRLKGACTSVFAQQMRITCLEIELAVKRQDWELVPPLVVRIEMEFERVKEYLQAHCNPGA